MGRIYEATWGRAFSALYDRSLKAAEDSGLREKRRRSLAAARGRALEIGAGTGANLGLYPQTVAELVLAEPDPHMRRQLREKVSASTNLSGRAEEIVAASAEALPFEDDAFDTVAFTLVLCTVPDPAASLAEAARVLKPGGRLLFLEHVRAEQPELARWQDRLERPWRLLGDGCHCNRDTIAAIERQPGLEMESLERGAFPKAPPILRPLASGAAVLGG